ncbi:hypothetical protein F5B21DRAFT_486988 [Xylaria acuta]|nr:hypothetical protein F5B21DRAFT_486988 [Xylaria acuta]
MSTAREAKYRDYGVWLFYDLFALHSPNMCLYEWISEQLLYKFTCYMYLLCTLIISRNRSHQRPRNTIAPGTVMIVFGG